MCYAVYVAGGRVPQSNDIWDVTGATDMLHTNTNASRPHGREEKERERGRGMEMRRKAPWDWEVGRKKVLTEETANSGRMVGLWIMFGFSLRSGCFSPCSGSLGSDSDNVLKRL